MYVCLFVCSVRLIIPLEPPKIIFARSLVLCLVSQSLSGLNDFILRDPSLIILMFKIIRNSTELISFKLSLNLSVNLGLSELISD